MKIADNIKSALIVDNKHDEVEELEKILHKEGIYYSFYTPQAIDEEQKAFKNHQIIFMDFSLDDTRTNPVENISLIRKALKKICTDKFGTYGLVLWTKHLGETNNIQLFKEKLSKDAEDKKYITPLFVIGLDKALYLKNNDFSPLWEDLNSELLENKAALFFFNWRHSVDVASDNALNYMYQLAPDYTKQAQQFSYLLYQMAENYSGIPIKDMQAYDGMYKDAYRAFDELLYSDLISQQSGFEDIFSKQINKPDYTFGEELEQIAKINSKLLLDLSITDQNVIMPGNVYQVVKRNVFLELQNSPKKPKYHPIPIAIEMTPPCDFSHKKVSSRLIGGFMIDCPKTKEDIDAYVNKNFKADSKYLIWPVDYNNEIRLLCFDFRNIDIESDEIIREASSYKLLFMVKHRLFADILQKFSSHAARLGLSILQPDITIPKINE